MCCGRSYRKSFRQNSQFCSKKWDNPEQAEYQRIKQSGTSGKTAICRKVYSQPVARNWNNAARQNEKGASRQEQNRGPPRERNEVPVRLARLTNAAAAEAKSQHVSVVVLVDL